MRNDTMHLFAGAGGGLLCDLILGHRPIIAVEWDKYACSVLRARAADGWFPDLSVWEGDVRLFDPSEYTGRVDCIHAGFPCQDISVAGKQAGVGEETRSGLYKEVLRIADVVRPRELYLENVSAILNNGLGTVLSDLSARGYVARWVCVRASDVGANHGRDRWWLLAREMGNSNNKRRTELLSATITGEQIVNSRANIENMGNIEGKRYLQLAHETEQGRSTARCAEGEFKGASEMASRNSSGGGYWSSEPNVGRVVDGVASRVQRLKALGNGQVPLQAAVAYSILEELFNDT